jgi:hypothetical protein
MDGRGWCFTWNMGQADGLAAGIGFLVELERSARRHAARQGWTGGDGVSRGTWARRMDWRLGLGSWWSWSDPPAATRRDRDGRAGMVFHVEHGPGGWTGGWDWVPGGAGAIRPSCHAATQGWTGGDGVPRGPQTHVRVNHQRACRPSRRRSRRQADVPQTHVRVNTRYACRPSRRRSRRQADVPQTHARVKHQARLSAIAPLKPPPGSSASTHVPRETPATPVGPQSRRCQSGAPSSPVGEARGFLAQPVGSAPKPSPANPASGPHMFHVKRQHAQVAPGDRRIAASRSNSDRSRPGRQPINPRRAGIYMPPHVQPWNAGSRGSVRSLG